MRGEGNNRGWDDWMSSPIRWTWVWVGFRSWWWTGKPGMLQSMELQSQTLLSDWTEPSSTILHISLYAKSPHGPCLPCGVSLQKRKGCVGWGSDWVWGTKRIFIWGSSEKNKRNNYKHKQSQWIKQLRPLSATKMSQGPAWSHFLSVLPCSESRVLALREVKENT